jgi:hypothetical protein
MVFCILLVLEDKFGGRGLTLRRTMSTWNAHFGDILKKRLMRPTGPVEAAAHTAEKILRKCSISSLS